MAACASEAGYETEIVMEDEGDFTVWCSRLLVPTEPAISEAEEQLESLARPYGGYPDGWGTSS